MILKVGLTAALVILAFVSFVRVNNFLIYKKEAPKFLPVIINKVIDFIIFLICCAGVYFLWI